MKVLSVFTMLNSSVPFVMMSCLGGCAATCIGVRHAESGLWCVCVCLYACVVFRFASFHAADASCKRRVHQPSTIRLVTVAANG